MSQRADFRHSGEGQVVCMQSKIHYDKLNTMAAEQAEAKLWQHSVTNMQYSSVHDSFIFGGGYGDKSAFSAALFFLFVFVFFLDGAVPLFQLSENQKQFTTLRRSCCCCCWKSDSALNG